MSDLSNVSQIIMRSEQKLGQSVLVLSAPGDHLLTHLASEGRRVHALNWDLVAQENQPHENDHLSRSFSLFPPSDFQADHIILTMPKAKEVLELYWAVLAAQLKNSDSPVKVWLVGEKKGGIEGASTRLRKEGVPISKLDSARHCQLWELRPRPETFPSLEALWRADALTLPDSFGPETLSIATLPGVFSRGRLDEGTELLLGNIPASLSNHASGARVLDFGCGCGVIGLAFKRAMPTVQMELVDASLLALESARRSAEMNSLDVNVYPSNGLRAVPAGLDIIVTNPPFHQGVKHDLDITREFLHRAREKLKPQGQLLLVANRFLPYADWIEDCIGKPIVVAENNKFKLYHAVRR